MSGGKVASSQIGTKSVNGSYFSLRTCGRTTNEGDIINKVLPSAAARDTYSVPISEPAPGRLSTTIDGPPAAPICCAVMRAITSAGPPGGNGTISRVVRPVWDHTAEEASAPTSVMIVSGTGKQIRRCHCIRCSPKLRCEQRQVQFYTDSIW